LLIFRAINLFINSIYIFGVVVWFFGGGVASATKFGRYGDGMNIALAAGKGNITVKIGDGDFYGAMLEVGMRYGNPSIDSALETLQAQGCEKIVVLPLYPWYAVK
jgi:hypothetical protein